MASKKQDRLIYESGQLFIQTPTGLDRDVNGEYIGLLDINILGDITVTGNLEVIGDTIDSGRVESSLEVSDKSIQLNRGEPNEGVTNLDGTLSESGITVDRGLTYDTGALDPDTGAPVFADRPADLSQGQYMHPASFAWIEGKTAWSFFSSDLDADDRAYDDTWVHPRLLEIGDPIGNHRPATPTDNYDLAATAIANADDPLLELARSAATVNWVASITNQLEYSVSELANKLPDGTDNDDILLWDTSTSAYVASSFEIEIDSDPVLGGNLDLHGHEIMFSSFGHLQEDIDGIRLTLADNNKFRLAGSAEITAEELLPLDISSHDADINIHTESTTNLNGNILLTAINSGEVRLRSETAIELTAPEVKVVGTLTIGYKYEYSLTIFSLN